MHCYEKKAENVKILALDLKKKKDIHILSM